MVAPTLATIAVKDATGTSKSMDALQDGANSNALAAVHGIVDGKLNTGVRATVNAGSTAAVAADPALVVEISPNNGVAIADGTTNTTVAKVLGSSVAAAAADKALEVAFNPYSTNNAVKVSDGTNLGTVKAASVSQLATDTALVVTERDRSKATYSTGANAFTLGATPGDVIQIQGSATATVRVKKIKVMGVATSAKTWPCNIIRRVAALTDGTAVTPVLTKFDTGDAGATAVVTHYTGSPPTAKAANPANSVLFTEDLVLVAPGTTPVPFVFDACRNNDKEIILRGAADCLVVNLGGGALTAGEKLTYEVEFSEDAS